jgi:phosphomethylpyrimidine synthase
VIAYKIAAHAADVALGIPGTRDRDDELTKARAALNWEKHFELSWDPDTARAYPRRRPRRRHDFCAMCGHDWCSVRISKEINEFVSGKDGEYAWELPAVSAALTDDQRAILERRGVSRRRRSIASRARRGARWVATAVTARAAQRPDVGRARARAAVARARPGDARAARRA